MDRRKFMKFLGMAPAIPAAAMYMEAKKRNMSAPENETHRQSRLHLSACSGNDPYRNDELHVINDAHVVIMGDSITVFERTWWERKGSLEGRSRPPPRRFWGRELAERLADQHRNQVGRDAGNEWAPNQGQIASDQGYCGEESILFPVQAPLHEYLSLWPYL